MKSQTMFACVLAVLIGSTPAMTAGRPLKTTQPTITNSTINNDFKSPTKKAYHDDDEARLIKLQIKVVRGLVYVYFCFVLVYVLAGTFVDAYKSIYHPYSESKASSTPVSNTTNTDSASPDNECSICFDNDTNVPWKTLPCNHAFHVPCIQEWVTKNDHNATCPLCRRSIDPSLQFS